jgi:hypothetical protein
MEGQRDIRNFQTLDNEFMTQAMNGEAQARVVDEAKQGCTTPRK